ncbi:T9SS type A sorting domain-containing protein [Flavilitoribacter nigricans]|uniref:T9SS type A sorting domain-containing protein n=1 Tax=Flavilitoribacter nigricans (strain ATCC 23147 / DSM 23189 / NBRC 102662 / NCIMB 1420 / SS-2) TaxID=1122177 RepID=A0A2D0N8W8_FLAN2|nr:hypothetical protein [Flavilitoribacter nigricans]PHN04838.1 hypothetical protein CRP01_20220 [Flavilitoribacter nigricans DSM 23189 = NBRC 102662]
MKHLFLLLCTLSLLTAVQAQPYGITGLAIDPAAPNEQDSVRALVATIFSTQQNLFAVEDTLINDTVYLDLHFCGGTLPAIDVREDTVQLGVFPVGDYQLVCTVSEYVVAIDEEGMLADTCALDTLYRDTLAFRVDLLDAVERLVPPGFRLAPNPAADHFRLSLDTPLRSVRLWSAGGRAVHEWRQLSGSQHYLDLPDLPQGIYYLEMQFFNRKPFWERLIIR